VAFLNGKATTPFGSFVCTGSEKALEQHQRYGVLPETARCRFS
jgi:hypothetical protein